MLLLYKFLITLYQPNRIQINIFINEWKKLINKSCQCSARYSGNFYWREIGPLPMSILDMAAGELGWLFAMRKKEKSSESVHPVKTEESHKMQYKTTVVFITHPK
jgi:hypothetical protein